MTLATAKPRFFLGWTVVFAAVLIAFSEVAFFNPVLGVFIPQVEKEFGWSRTEISLGVTIGSLSTAVFAPFFGPLIDRYGGRPFVVGGGLLMAVALVAFSLMDAKWQFYIIYGLGRGTAAGLIGLAAGVTVSKWFVRRRGFAVGVMSVGSRAGVAVLPISVQLIIQASAWRTAALSLAGVVIVCGVLPALLWLHARPERFGLQPDGNEPLPPVPASAPRPPPREVSWTRRDALHTRAFWFIAVALGLSAWASGGINLHQIPHLIDRGLSPESAALIVSLLAIFSGLGAFFEGVLDATIGSRWTLVVGLVGSASGVLILININSVAMGMAFAVIYGTAFGLMLTSGQIVFAEYFGRKALGAIRGSAAPVQMGLNAIGPLVTGAAYDLTGSYTAAFIPFTGAYLIAAAGMALARKPASAGAQVVPLTRALTLDPPRD